MSWLKVKILLKNNVVHVYSFFFHTLYIFLFALKFKDDLKIYLFIFKYINKVCCYMLVKRLNRYNRTSFIFFYL